MNRHTPWRTGMVGAGYMAKLHSLSMNNLAGLSQDPRDRFELVRIVDSDLAAAEQEAGRWGWKAFGDDWRQVTRSAEI
ncbi:Gfo/Idh/MocA family oxidoreductase, partial [Pseudomonas sp.]|uniref:Gfo/Idh/MocA family oxidoreductase n=1 Tax=Pseudomonas sp. TaxID=306 RepID=UPI002590A3C4